MNADAIQSLIWYIEERIAAHAAPDTSSAQFHAQAESERHLRDVLKECGIEQEDFDFPQVNE